MIPAKSSRWNLMRADVHAGGVAVPGAGEDPCDLESGVARGVRHPRRVLGADPAAMVPAVDLHQHAQADGVVAQLPAGLPHRFGGVCAEGDADCAAEAAEPFGLPGIDPQGVGDEEVRGDGQADGARLELQGGDLGILWVLTCGLRASPSSSFVRF